jgi:hypothetical protein
MKNTKIFFTGVPGSRWSGIAQIIEDNVPGFNTSDRCPEKEYMHHSFSGHKGAYFGTGMEFLANLDGKYLDSAWPTHGGICLVKSHEWAYKLNELKEAFPEDKIILVYRPDMTSYAWWHEAGGFQIKYPDYTAYKDSTTMLASIMEQNKCILQFARKHNAIWYHFGSKFIKDIFNVDIPEVSDRYTDCLITIIS